MLTVACVLAHEHVTAYFTRQHELPNQVRFDHLAKIRGGCVDDVGAVDDARVIDERVDSAAPAADGMRKGQHILFVSDVERPNFGYAVAPAGLRLPWLASP
jgi:hypothetical protein